MPTVQKNASFVAQREQRPWLLEMIEGHSGLLSIHMVFSVNRHSGCQSGNSVLLTGLSSQIEPMMSPIDQNFVAATTRESRILTAIRASDISAEARI
jgi:hypothetical protein